MSLTIATFNVRNLIEAGKTIYGGSKPTYSQEEYSSKVQWIGERLREMDADVIGFQEVWQMSALKECFKAVGLEDDYDFVGRDAPSQFQVQVAFAVRKGWLRGSATWHETFPENAIFKKGSTDDSTYQMDVAIDNFSRPPL